MFFDVQWQVWGNIRHLKKGIGAPVWLGAAGFNGQQQEEEGMAASGGSQRKKDHRPAAHWPSGHLTPYLLSKKQRMGHGPDRGQSCSGWPTTAKWPMAATHWHTTWTAVSICFDTNKP